jgi:hypothetical protein
MRSIFTLLAVAVLAIAFGSATAQPLSGAIFTTTPDGGIVNENVRYESKLEVYLDGGPPPNAPQTAAGLPDGLYVFQITDPSGWVLLSDDPSKCRVMEVYQGVIVGLVPPSSLLSYGADGINTYTKPLNGRKTTAPIPCHVQDEPDGVAGPSGQHDTNIDTDWGSAGAIVVQMMPFLDTPNPGGVYKAWVTPIQTYIDRMGDLNAHPLTLGVVKKRGVVQGYRNDPGYGPPRSVQKTDNFKVKEKPPMIHVHKFHDIDGDGYKDADEPEITGWEITIRETLYDGSYIENTCYTPCWRTVAPGSTVTVTEATSFDGKDWEISYVIVDDISQKPPTRSVDVVFAPGDLKHTVEFGNFMLTPKSGIKCKDLKADGKCDSTDPLLKGWTIKASGTTGMGDAFSDTQMTDENGEYEFSLPPGTYSVYEQCPDDTWYQSLPKPTGYTCGNGRYDNIVIKSGDAPHLNNDFGNFQAARVVAKKFNDRDGDGMKDDGEEYLADVEFCLLQGGAKVDASDFLKTPQAACLKTDATGTVEWNNLFPNTYTVQETLPTGAFPTATVVEIAGAFYKKVVGPSAATIDLPFLDGCAKTGVAKLIFGDGFKCVGLTPGYWKNWRNHYTSAEFNVLIQGTIAGSIADADAILGDDECSGLNALDCMRKFLLANQLTLNLTVLLASGESLFNGDDAGLSPQCVIPGYPGTLAYWLDQALMFHVADKINGGNRQAILDVKNMLDRFANMEIRP